MLHFSRMRKMPQKSLKLYHSSTPPLPKILESLITVPECSVKTLFSLPTSSYLNTRDSTQGFKCTNFTAEVQSVSGPGQRSRLGASTHDDEQKHSHSLLLLAKRGATADAALKQASAPHSCLQKKALTEQPQPTWKNLNKLQLKRMKVQN